MEFRLTYEGLLFSTQKDPVSGQKDKRADHKADIRRYFHPQLKRLWQTNEYLTEGRPRAGDVLDPVTYGCTLIEKMEQDGLYKRGAFSFITLVRSDLSLICSLNILFLRPDKPGNVLASGDIDGRLKTLFDALRLPKYPQEMTPYQSSPSSEEAPFFCLLEDDDLITHVSVETDMLLQPTIPNGFNPNDTRIVISVKLRPYDVSAANINFI